MVFVPGLAFAQTNVAPGSSVQISQATGGATSCQIALVSASCSLFGRFNGTIAVAPDNKVYAHYDQLLPAIGAANYARAAIFADFTLPGSPATLVDAQISTTFDARGALFGGGAYKGAVSLTLKVSDLSVSGVALATDTLFEQDRSGDQGLTDVTAGSETQAVFGNNSSIHVKLRRGHVYRLTFELEVLGEALLVGKVISDADATWTNSRISVDEDEVDLLLQHDTAVRGELATHDQAVRSALATHDADVKKKLDEILAKLDQQAAELAEIKRLLLTPEGRRPGFPIK
jgi:hypothetical protein